MVPEGPPPLLVKELTAFGLADDEAKGFLILSMQGLLRASEVADATSIPRSSVYAVLKGLMDRGLVEATVERPMRFYGIPMRDALDRLIHDKRRRIEALEARRTLLEALPSSPQMPERGAVHLVHGSAGMSHVLERVEDDDRTILVGRPESRTLASLLDATRGKPVTLVTNAPIDAGGAKVRIVSGTALPTMVLGSTWALLVTDEDELEGVLVENAVLVEGLRGVIEGLPVEKTIG